MRTEGVRFLDEAVHVMRRTVMMVTMAWMAVVTLPVRPRMTMHQAEPYLKQSFPGQAVLNPATLRPAHGDIERSHGSALA